MDFAGDIQRHEVGVAACDFREGALFWVREVALALRNLHAWFTFFSPYDHPEIAIVVLVEGGGEGHDTAEPVAVKIADYYYSHRAQILGTQS